MKKRFWMFGFLLAIALVFSACAKTNDTPATSADGGMQSDTQATAKEGKSYRIGIVQLTQHPALDSATRGFQDALKEEFGDAVTFDVKNASGEVANVTTIVNGFVAANPDLILANATAPLQVAASATSTIPILGTSVTDYATALELKDFNGTIGTNVSGTSDLAPLDEQAEVLHEWFPNAKTVGIIYSTSEANSVFQVQEMTKRLVAMGYTVKPFSFTDSNDLPAVVTQAVAESDVLYEPTDNVASSNAEAIANIVLPAKCPVITGEAEPARVFGIATVSIDYEELGRATGKMAAAILCGEKQIQDMPIEYAPSAKKMVNRQNAEALGLSIPEGYEELSASKEQ